MKKVSKVYAYLIMATALFLISIFWHQLCM